MVRGGRQNLKRLKERYMHWIPIKNYIRDAKDKYIVMFSGVAESIS